MSSGEAQPPALVHITSPPYAAGTIATKAARRAVCGPPVDAACAHHGDPQACALLRLLEQALANVARRAQARGCVRLERCGDDVVLTINDEAVAANAAARPGAPALGLRDMSDRLVLLDGAVEVESRPGRGKTVVVRFPLLRGAPRSNRRTRLVIADDHGIVREGLKRILAGDPSFELVGEAKDGHEVLAAVRAGGFDLLLLDLSMPGRSGIDLVRQVKAERPDLRVLVLSMYAEEQYAVRAIRAGASGYVNKKSVLTQLMTALRKIAGGGLFITPAVAEALALDLQAPAAGALPHERLTDREHEIFLLLVAGHSVSAIGGRLRISVKTISTHKKHIHEKLGLSSLAELVRYAVAHKLLDLPDAPK